MLGRISIRSSPQISLHGAILPLHQFKIFTMLCKCTDDSISGKVLPVIRGGIHKKISSAIRVIIPEMKIL